MGGTVIAVLTLGGCSVGDSTSTASASITVGTIDKVTSPTEYTVVLKKGLTFADIKFSFDRPQKIASQVGLGMLLHTLVRHAASDATTVVFTVKATNGPGGEIRHIVFNFDTRPFGAKAGGPDGAKARSTLTSADITAQVVLSLQHDTDHYGASSGAEYALVTSQLEQGGLFTVNLQSTDWGTNSKDRTKDAYPEYQLGWFPDYSDADNYLSPFFTEGNFLRKHYDNAEVDPLIGAQAVETDASKRTTDIETIQDKVAADQSTVPLLQGAQVAVSGKKVSGVTRDGSFEFRFGTLSEFCEEEHEPAP